MSTLLIDAIKARRTKWAYKLLHKQTPERYDVSINATDEDGRSALMLACGDRQEFLVPELLAFPGIKYQNERCKEGRSVVHYAVRGGSEAVLRAVISVASTALLNGRDKDGGAPILDATDQGREVLVEALMETGRVDATNQNNEGLSPVMLACIKRYASILLIFDKYGVDFEGHTCDGRYPMNFARGTRDEVIIHCIRLGAKYAH